MQLPRRHRKHGPEPEAAAHGHAGRISEGELSRMFEAPTWFRDLGLLAWFLVGVGAVFVGGLFVLQEISTIVAPVVAGGIIAAVASPLVAKLQHRGVRGSPGPRSYFCC